MPQSLTPGIVPKATMIVDSINGAVLTGRDGHGYRLVIADSKPVRLRTGWLYAAISIAAVGGESAATPLAMGIVSGGGRLVMPWMELRIYPEIKMVDGATFDARAAGLDAALLDLIGELIPPGGHLMIEYESPGQNETHAALLLRVPPAATELGSMMFHAGFRGAFKDWYISEGGHEGPRKLQANKSPTPAATRAATIEHREELLRFLKREAPHDETQRTVIARAKARARSILDIFAKSR